MITAGDVEFEPPQPKVFPLTTSIAVMIAGDSSMQMEILYPLREQVRAAIDADPARWVSVKDVASWYYEHYEKARNLRAERALLSPLGLTRENFVSSQSQLQTGLVNRLASELVNFEAPQIEAIIAGVDSTGPHIYVADNKGVTVRDSAGFAAIGVGYWHSNSQFMFAGHAKWKPMPEVLLLTYESKRRAVVAPGVGEGTDMFMIGPQLGSYFSIGEHVLKALDKIYTKTRKKELASQKQARLEVNKYVEELGKKSEEVAGQPATQQQPALPSDVGAVEEAQPAAPGTTEDHEQET
jgi:hypothetical protein